MSAAARLSSPQTNAQKMVFNMIAGQLVTNQIINSRILQAIADTPREDFVPGHLKHSAYVDANLDMGDGRHLLAPLTFARLLSLAAITPGCRVLDIGCLNGYSTAILAKLAGHVVAVDTSEEMIGKTKANLKGAGDVDIQKVTSLAGGYGMSAPYDVIIIEGAINFVPEELGLQLSEGGRIATLFRKDQGRGLVYGTGKGLLIRRLEGSLQYREHFDAAAAILPGFERETSFTL